MNTKTRPTLLKAAAFAAIALLSTATSQAAKLYEYASLGNAAATTAHNWAIFTFGTPVNNGLSAVSTIAGSTTINGSVGAAGKANYSIANGPVINGYLTYKVGGSIKTSNAAAITGGQNTTMGPVLDAGVNDATAASRTAAALASTSPAVTDLTLSNTALTLNAASDASASRFVFNLSSLNLSNSTLTLNGTANQSYVFNISGGMKINQSNIFLSGGLTADNVLFNYLGAGDVTITNTGKTINGIILAAGKGTAAAPNLNYQTTSVTMVGGTLNGYVVANKVTISSATINTVVSP